MKKSEIVIGGIYENGKGGKRRIIDRTDDGRYRLYAGQMETDCVLYEVMNNGTKNNRSAGQTRVSSAASFASWAKKKIG